ncbi:MAG TPA: hypothetical protein ENI42_03460 [Thermoplasmatales archaeon]|nr:hypothetical protein [Thermoplasmatales archaeon]
MVSKVVSVMEQVISFFEKERFNLLTLFIWVFMLSAVRMWTEAQLFNYPYKELSYCHVFTYTHLIVFGYTTGVGAILILKLLTKERLVKIVNLSALGGAIILVPPLLDFFVFKRTEPYRYISVNRLLEMFSSHSFDLSEFGGPGLVLELALVIVLTTLYVYVKTRSVVKTFVNFFVFLGFISFMVIPTFNPLLAFWSNARYGGLTQPVLVVYFLLLGVVFLLLLLRVCRKGFVSVAVATLHPLYLVFFVAAAVFGVLVAGHLQFGVSPVYAGNFGTFGIGLFTVFFLWLCFMFLKHVSDVRNGLLNGREGLVSSGFMTVGHVRSVVVILVVAAVTLAVNLSVVEAVLCLVALFFAWFYSLKYVRLKRFLSSVFLGVEASLMFFIGYFVPSYSVTGEHPPFEFIKTSPELTGLALLVGLFVLVVFSVASIVYYKLKKEEVLG